MNLVSLDHAVLSGISQFREYEIHLCNLPAVSVMQIYLFGDVQY